MRIKPFYLFALLFVPAVGLTFAESVYLPVDSVKGPMCVITDPVTNLPIPLSPRQSTYNILVTDGLAQLTLTQLFVNDYGTIDDIVYVFPLPHDAAVHAMSMEYQSSLYKAEIFEKQEAKQIYDSIVKNGGVAALLLQERPNVFQQRLANIAHHDSAWVQIKLTLPLSYDNGIYELAVPTMVAERFQSAGEEPVPSNGRWNPPPDRDGQSLQINVLLQTGFPLAQLQSPTHPLVISELEAIRPELVKRRLIEEETDLSMPNNRGALLQQATTYPNKDFVLRFSRQGSDMDFTAASYYDPDLSTGYFYSALFPDTSLFVGERAALDIVLLIDISGSQSGWPLQREKEIASHILSKLTSADRITVLSFNDAVTWCFGAGTSVEASSENVGKAEKFITDLSASGGTNLLSGVNAALTTSQDGEKSRFFIFLTDGFITNEDKILSAIKEHPTSPTIFTFGAGNNLNRYFLDEAAKVGNGVSTELTESEVVGPVVDNVWNKIESPQLRDISISFTGLESEQLLLPQGEILYKGAPVTIFGVYREGGQHEIIISGNREGKAITLTKTVELAEVPTGNAMIPQVWARQMIRKLRVEEGETTKNKSHIIELSKQYQVLSDYTAFLASVPETVTDENTIRQYTRAEVTPAVVDRLMQITVRIVRNQLAIESAAGEYLREIEVFDLSGRCLFRKRFSVLNCSRFSWDGRFGNGSMLIHGRFVVHVKTTRGQITRSVFWQ